MKNVNTLIAILFFTMLLFSCDNNTKDIYEVGAGQINQSVLAIVDSYINSYPEYKNLAIVSDFKFKYFDKDVIERETDTKLYAIGRLSKYICYKDSLICTGDKEPYTMPFPTMYFIRKGVKVFCFSSNDRLIHLEGAKSFFDINADTVREPSTRNPLWAFAVDRNNRARILTKDIKTYGDKHISQPRFQAPVSSK